MFKKDYKKYLNKCLLLAQKGEGTVSPNPKVGAVIVKNGKIIGKGYHEKFGEPHAEINAIKSCKVDPKGATLFVNLEPCAHFGKQPPCVDAIIKAGLKKVVVSALDPSKKVNGKGIKILKKNGLEIEYGIQEKEAEELNEEFYTFHRKKRPFIALKVALSLDGKISFPGRRILITDKKANQNTLKLRTKYQSILIGAGTALVDNPNLGIKKTFVKDPLRIILVGRRKMPKNLEIFRDKNYLIFKNKNPKKILKELYEKEILSILIEGGQKVYSSFIKEKLVDKFYIYVSPKILGKKALEFTTLNTNISLKVDSVRKFGRDILITATPEWDS